jgi:DNA mismatch endonuclease, patch repair protein
MGADLPPGWHHAAITPLGGDPELPGTGVPVRGGQHAQRKGLVNVAGYQPWASNQAVRRVMQGNRKRDTRPEIALRRVLHSRGLRYRVAAKPLADRPWTADLVFRGLQLAVFVDGCYWHGCPEHYTVPRTNTSYWSEKIARNRARDAQVDADLRAAGWTALRIWEHEPVQSAADRVLVAHGRLRDVG